MDFGGISLSLIKQMSLCIISYYLGHFQLSIMWIIVPLILQRIKFEKVQQRLLKRDFIRNMTTNGEEATISSFQHLPAWVCFPDMERAEWINKIIRQLWPNVNSYVHDIIKELLETKLNKKLAKYGLSGLKFAKLVVGSVPFRIGGIVVFENVSANEIVFDMDLTYAGDCDIALKFSKMKGSIKDFQLYGRLRMILKPLLNTLPLAGGIQLFFVNPPEIDFTLEGLAGLLEFPMLNDLLKKVILDTICSLMVLPNMYPIRLTKKVSKQDIKWPNPKGVLRVHVVQAKKLMKRDLSLLNGELTSDPYAVITIGDQTYTTPVKAHTTKPKWDYWCEFVIEQVSGVYMYISLWDEDTIQEDEPLGRTKIRISKMVESTTTDMWLTLENVRRGQVHIRTTWLTLSTKQEDLKNALEEVKLLQVSKLSTAILTVYINSATNLGNVESSKKSEIDVVIGLGKQERNTRGFKKQTDPVWEEGFVFLVQNPDDDFISFHVQDEEEKECLGEFIYNIQSLFEENELRLDKQSFKLSKCQTDGKIVLSMALQILKNVSFSSSGEVKDNKENDNYPLDLLEHSSLSGSSPVSSTSSDSSSDKSDILSSAKIKLTLRYSVQRQRLIVVVHHVEDLSFDETKGIYVKLYLLPERHKDTKRKTKVIRTNGSPVYDERFEFVISQDELKNKHLELSVCEERIVKNEALEKVVIDLDKLSLVLPYSSLFKLFKKTHES